MQLDSRKHASGKTGAIQFEIKPNSGVFTLWLLSTSILLFFILYKLALNDIENSDPFSFTDGITVWPTILIRLFTLLLALAFIFRIIYMLETNFHRLTRKEFQNSRDKEREILFPDKDPMSVQLLIKKLIIKSTRIFHKYSNKDCNLSDYSRTITITAFFLSGVCGYAYAINIQFNELFFTFLVFLFVPISLAIVVIAVVMIWLLLTKLNEESKKYFQFDPISDTVSLFFYLVPIFFAFKCNHPELIPLLFNLPLLYLLSGFKSLEVKSIQSWVERDSIRNRWDLTILGQTTKKYLLDNGTKKNKKVIEMNNLWEEYREYGVPEQRFMRTTIMWLIFMNFNAFLIHLFPESLSFCRGNTCDLDKWIFIFCISISMFIIFLVLDAQRLCLHWIEKLCTKHPLLVDITLLDKPGDKAIVYFERNRKDINQTLEKIILLVAERTYAVDKLIYFPIIVLMLMFLARIVYFDYLDFPLSNGIVSIISISLLLYAGLKLRTEASQLKLAVVENAPNPEEMIKKLEQFNYGAFQPMSEQPVVRSALLLLGSLGLFAAEYLMLFGY